MRTLGPRPLAVTLSALALAMTPTPHVEAQDADAWALGTWEGALVAGPQTLRIVFHVSRAEGGGLGGTMDVPAQGAVGIPLSTVTVEGSSLDMTFPVPGGGRYVGERRESGEIEGTFTQGPASFPMTLSAIEGEVEAPARPQEPKPPYPYEVRDVAFPNAAAGITLAGTLTRPEGAGPVPGVVLVSGSGPQDRDEALMGHKPFHVLADHLTRAGIAVLRYDDRGVGASEGDFASADSEDLMSDALAALRFLAGVDGVAADRVGIVGHSEGGLLGPMAAAASGDVRFVVMLAGPGMPGIDILVEQGRLIGRAAGASEEVLDLNAHVQLGLAGIVAEEPDTARAAERMRTFLRDVVAGAPAEHREAVASQLDEAGIERTVRQMNGAWFRYFLHHDPRPALEAVSVPVLALFGEKDLQVPPAQSAAEVEAAFDRGGNPDATVRVLPGLNHLFQHADTGSPTEYARIEETMNPAALEAVSAWILERFGPPAP